MRSARRLAALRRFAIAITLLNVVGNLWLGFEQAWAHLLVAVATAYGLELVLEMLQARADGRPPRFAGGLRALVDFLLSAHITGLAVAMLLYTNHRLLPVAFATSVAIASKTLLRAPVGGSWRHFMNPSNTGIAGTLLLFPWVGIAPPYMFTENLTGAGDWLLPALIVCSGTFLHARCTGRLPLIAAWLGTFVLQAWLRHVLLAARLDAALFPMTGVAFVLFTLYMAPDPGTTPATPRAQMVFGAAVALTYGALMAMHVVFGLFFALVIVCALRGAGLWLQAARRVQGERTAAVGVAES